jgi:hypothetical protein
MDSAQIQGGRSCVDRLKGRGLRSDARPGSPAKWPAGHTQRLVLIAVGKRGRLGSNDRSQTGGGAGIGKLPAPDVRTLLRGFGIPRLEVFERLLRLRLGENPGRTLRIGRTRERLAKVRTNDLPGDSERVRKRLGPEGLGGLGRHSIDPFVWGNASRSLYAQYERSNVRCQVKRLIVCGRSIERANTERTFVFRLGNVVTCDNPRPATRQGGIVEIFDARRAKRVGPGSSVPIGAT